MSFLSAVPAIIGGIGSLFGKSSTPKAATQTLPNQQQAANQYLDLNNSLPNYGADLYPQYQSLVSSLQNNPYAGQAISGAQAASGIGTNAANQAANAGTSLYGLADSLTPYLQSIAGAAFDPQQELYNRTLQQTQDQQRVAQAARGIAMSPYGAGLENDALKNFNIDWQNNLLNRMTTGASSIGNLLNTIGQGYSGAAQLGEGATNLMSSASGLPYSTAQGIGSNDLTALQALSQAANGANTTQQQQIQNLLAYLQAGNASNATATSAAGQQFNQNQVLGQGLGNALSFFSPGGQGTNFFSTLSNTFAPPANYNAQNTALASGLY
jgi:hypothetical protein